ncbi:MAG: sensor histidine kinase [Burkholderiaceae bacterium]
MLFNTLATVRALVRADPPAAQQMLDRLIDFYRATLDTAREPMTTVGREFAMLEDYLGLMQVRLGERLSFRLTIGPGTDALALPALLLQPLVENAIRHAIEPSKQGGEVRVRSMLESGMLHLLVHNSGVGISDDALARVRQFAMARTGEAGQAAIAGRVDALLATSGDSAKPGSGGMGLGLLAERLRSTHAERARFTVTRPAGGGTQIDIWLPAQAAPGTDP